MRDEAHARPRARSCRGAEEVQPLDRRFEGLGQNRVSVDRLNRVDQCHVQEGVASHIHPVTGPKEDSLRRPLAAVVQTEANVTGYRRRSRRSRAQA